MKSTLYTSVFMFRRAILAMVSVFLSSAANWLVICFIELQGLYLVYLLASRPHYWPSENVIELINEVILLVFGYCLLLSTDFVPTAEL